MNKSPINFVNLLNVLNLDKVILNRLNFIETCFSKKIQSVYEIKRLQNWSNQMRIALCNRFTYESLNFGLLSSKMEYRLKKIELKILIKTSKKKN